MWAETHRAPKREFCCPTGRGLTVSVHLQNLPRHHPEWINFAARPQWLFPKTQSRDCAQAN